MEATYSFTTAPPTFVPWVGTGIGYEWLEFKGPFTSVHAKGLEFVNLQVGSDVKVSEQLSAGPYLLLSFGQYSEASGQSIRDKATHEWLGFGVRGKFDL